MNVIIRIEGNTTVIMCGKYQDMLDFAEAERKRSHIAPDWDGDYLMFREGSDTPYLVIMLIA